MKGVTKWIRNALHFYTESSGLLESAATLRNPTLANFPRFVSILRILQPLILSVLIEAFKVFSGIDIDRYDFKGIYPRTVAVP